MANDNNQGAPAAADNAAETGDTAVSTADDKATGAKTTDNAGTETPAFDPRTSYDSLKSELSNLNKSYGELRRTYTQTTQGYSDLQKKFDNMLKVFQDATKEEISPEDFMKALQSQGVKAFDPLKKQWQDEMKSSYEKQLEQIQTDRMADRVELEVMKRRLDSVRYPDFQKLEDKMGELANDPNAPIDWSKDINVIYDTLYKLAKANSADTAIKEARAQGLKEAEGKLAREAGTAVATGGKAASVSNPADIKDLKKLREYFVAQLGEAE